jgi:TonB family protein
VIERFADIALILFASYLSINALERDASAAAGSAKRQPERDEPELARALFFGRNAAEEELALECTSFTAEVVRDAAIARTIIAIEVEGGENAQVEAIMRIPVPVGAAVMRAVLDVEGTPMEGVFVDRVSAESAYRNVVARGRDPLLVAWHDRGWIDVSLFPVPAYQRRKLWIEWLEPIATRGKAIFYRIPRLGHRGRIIRELDSLKAFGKSVSASSRREISIADVLPPEIAVAHEPGEPFAFVLARSKPRPVARPLRAVIVVDTSAAMSSKARLEERLVVERLLVQLPEEAEVRLLAADWGVEEVVPRYGARNRLELLDGLDAIASAGAFDLEHTLLSAVDLAEHEGATGVVLVGGGHDRFHRDALEVPMARFAKARIPLYTINVAGSLPAYWGQCRLQPMTMLRQEWLADAAWMAGGLTADANDVLQIARSLRTRARERPPEIGEVDAWDPLETAMHETVWVGRTFGIPPANAVRATARDLGALWARAAYRPRPGEERDQRYRAITPLTSIVALETQADYAEWKLPEPDAARHPSESGGEGYTHRSERGSNVLGLGGHGTGINNAIGGRGARCGGRGITRIIAGRILTAGALSKREVRRVIGSNLARFKVCYEKSLDENPTLEGEIAVHFTIAPTGEVARTSVREASMKDENVESCILEVMRSLQFPRPPGGGVVTVTYPLRFSNGAREPAPSPPQRCTLCPTLAESADLAANAKAGRLDDVALAEIARIFGAPSGLEREPLAWWIVQHRLRPSDVGGAGLLRTSGAVQFSWPYGGWLGYLIAASLLRGSAQPVQAERVLSEIAHVYPDEIERRMRGFGYEESAQRIKALARCPISAW